MNKLWICNVIASPKWVNAPLDAALIHRMEPYRHSGDTDVMSLPAVSEDLIRPVLATCHAAPLIREAALGRLPWAEAARAIAENAGAEAACVVRLEPRDLPSQALLTRTQLFASQAFLSRWHEAGGHTHAAEHGGGADARHFDLVPNTYAYEDGYLENTFRRQGILALALESHQGFYALLIERPVRSESISGECSRMLQCVAELERAADMELVVRQAQQAMALHILDSGGTSAFILDHDGWVRNQNECARELFGQMLHFPGTAATELDGGDAHALLPSLKKLLPLERIRASQYSILTPTGRKLMIYAVPWRRNSSIFTSGDELLIAWDMRAEAPMLGTWKADPNGPLAQSLRETFGLTKTESLLALHLVGSNLRDAAADCGMAYETARSHIKSIFSRMKIGNQGELTGLLSRFAYHERLRRALSAS